MQEHTGLIRINVTLLYSRTQKTLYTQPVLSLPETECSGAVSPLDYYVLLMSATKNKVCHSTSHSQLFKGNHREVMQPSVDTDDHLKSHFTHVLVRKVSDQRRRNNYCCD